MGKTLSPLRYPGGKSQTIKNVQRIIEMNNFRHRTYVEPFAGGFGVGLALLIHNDIEQAIINDSDIHVYHFWESALHNADELIALITTTPISLAERLVQKEIYSNPDSTALQDGFATLYLNRVNYSGVLFAGPIGGNTQSSTYSLGCRFNKDDIINRIRSVNALRDRIRLFNLDANDLVIHELAQENAHTFYNIDPPYVKKGKSLYSEYFTEQEHRAFGTTVQQHMEDIPWIITYDSCDLVREIYQGYHIQEFELYHSAHNRTRRTELVITNLPEDMFVW